MSFKSVFVAAISAVVFGYVGGIVTGINLETQTETLRVIRPLSPAPASPADYNAQFKSFEAKTIERPNEPTDDSKV